MLFVLRKRLIIKLVNTRSSDQVGCVCGFFFLFEEGNGWGLEQKRERRRRQLIIIALPEGSIRRSRPQRRSGERRRLYQLNLTRALNKAARRILSCQRWNKRVIKTSG